MNGGGEERDCELNVSITRRCHQKPDKGDTESLEYEDLCAPARGGEGPGESLILFYSTIRYRHQGRHQGRHPVPEPVGTWGKMESRERNEFVCCVSRDGARRGSSHDSYYGGPSRRLIRAGQKFYMSETCGWIQGAGSLLILGSTCIEMSRSPGCL